MPTPHYRSTQSCFFMYFDFSRTHKLLILLLFMFNLCGNNWIHHIFFLFFLRWIIANCYKSNEIEWPMCGSHLVVFQSKILMTIEWMGENKWLKIEWMKKQKKKRGNKEYENEKHSEECDWMTFLRPFHCLNKPAWDSGNWNTHSLLCSDLKCIRYWIDPVRKGKHR